MNRKTRLLVGAVLIAGLGATAVLVRRGGGDEDFVRSSTGAGVFALTTTNSTSWTVPSDVTSITIIAVGASGRGPTAGLGVTVTATVPVLPGERLTLVVAPTSLGCTLVSRTYGTDRYLVVAGAGGGTGGSSGDALGGAGGNGGLIGQSGEPGKNGSLSTVTAINSQTNATVALKDLPLVGYGGIGGNHLLPIPKVPNVASLRYAWPPEALVSGSVRGGVDTTLASLATEVASATRWPLSAVTFEPAEPEIGGLGGESGCGMRSGQGGYAGVHGASGGGGGGGSSHVIATATDVTSSLNPSRLSQSKITIRYTVDSTSSSVVTLTTVASAVSSTTSTSTSTTSTTSTSPTSSTIPATTIPSGGAGAPATTIVDSGTMSSLPTQPQAVSIFQPVSASVSVRTQLQLPNEVKIRKVSINSKSKKVCRAVKNVVLTLSRGSCRFTASVTNGRRKWKIEGQIIVE